MASAKHSVDPLQASLFDVFAPPSLATKEPTSTLESEAPSPLAPNTTNAAPFAEPPAEISLEEPAGPFIYSVSQLSAELRDTLQHDFARVFVQGEICDFKGIHRSGHAYFGLKDAEAQIRAVMWRPTVQKTAFELKGGLEVIASGKIDYYPGSGSLQIVIDTLEPVGIGALQLKFEQLKEKLAREGLFDAARKRKISALNWRIGIVTGRSTAALQDMLKIFQLRFPLAEIYLFHAAVQGERAPQEIATAIELANRYSSHSSKALDLLIVGRGGGSYEDLFCFNDEIVARALAQSKFPPCRPWVTKLILPLPIWWPIVGLQLPRTPPKNLCPTKCFGLIALKNSKSFSVDVFKIA